MQKLQYDMETLAEMLGTGRIQYISAVIVGDKQMLRVDCEESAEEYKTVRASKKAKPARAKPDNYKPRNKSLQFDRDVPEPDTRFGAKAAEFGGKLGKGLVTWIRTPPRKRPEDW